MKLKYLLKCIQKDTKDTKDTKRYKKIRRKMQQTDKIENYNMKI